jgi:DNA invertase Pin-like site-specific DNA recombinase
LRCYVNERISLSFDHRLHANLDRRDQAAGLEAQRRDLMAAGVEKLFTEQASSVGARPVLEQALSFVREGDVFVVTKIDRLARSIVNLCEIVARVEKRTRSASSL